MPVELQSKQYDTFVIKHKFDVDCLLVSFEQQVDLGKLFKDFVMKSLDRSFPTEDEVCVGVLNDTNKNSFGKICIKIERLDNFICS